MTLPTRAASAALVLLVLTACHETAPSGRASAIPDGEASQLTPATEATPAAIHSNCALDAINGAPALSARLPAGSGTTFEGWVVDDTKRPAGRVHLFLKGPRSFDISGTTGIGRADVAAAVAPQAELAGFKIEVAHLNVPPGRYSIAIDAADHRFRCETNANVIVH